MRNLNEILSIRIVSSLAAYTSTRVFSGVRVLKGEEAKSALARARKARERLKDKAKIPA